MQPPTKKHVPFTIYEGGFGHGGKTWNVFFFWWISRLPSYHDSFRGQIQDCIHHGMGCICLVGYAIWTQKCPSHLLVGG